MSRNTEFRSLPFQTKTSLPSFTLRQIDIIYSKQQFGLLSPLPTAQLGNDDEGSVSSLPDRSRPFTDVLRTITDLKTDFCEENRLRGDCCLSDEEIWTCDNDNLI